MIRTATFIALVLFMLAAAAFLFVAKAEAQPMPPCAPQDEMRLQLAERYGEQSNGRGIVSGNVPQILELFVSQSGSWTVVITGADLMSCMKVSGERWQGRGWREASQ